MRGVHFPHRARGRKIGCRKVSRYRRDAVKISIGASKHSRRLGAQPGFIVKPRDRLEAFTAVLRLSSVPRAPEKGVVTQ